MAGLALVIDIFACGAFLLVVGPNTVELWLSQDLDGMQIAHNEGIYDSKFRTE